MEELENGCLGVGDSYDDFLLGGEEVDGLPDLKQQDAKIFEYDQSGTLDCTLYSAFGAISDLFNYEFSKKEINEMVAESYKRGRIAGHGRYIKNAVDLVADYWNEHHSNLGKVVYYRISLYDTELVDKILTKNYTLCSGYQGNTAYNKDRNDNAILNGTTFPGATYGHAVSWIGRNGKRYIKDNYKGRKSGNLPTNIYKVEHKPSELVSGQCYYANAYVYIKVDNTEEIKRLEKIKTECGTCITTLGSIYNSVNDTNFQGVLHYTADKLRAKIKTCEEMLKNLR